MDLRTEVKRKIFHHLSLLYLALYAALPERGVVWLLGLAIVGEGSLEFIRIRRPEINAWFLNKFGGIHRVSEITKPSGIFWTLLGCWMTMVVFTDRKLVMAALGFLVFGDTAAALVGKKWGRHHWASRPAKTKEGSAGFAAVSFIWAAIFFRWPVALLGSVAGAFIELQDWPWNDNFWIPLISALALSILNLLFGRSHR